MAMKQHEIMIIQKATVQGPGGKETTLSDVSGAA